MAPDFRNRYFLRSTAASIFVRFVAIGGLTAYAVKNATDRLIY